jgi:hypothetical protein
MLIASLLLALARSPSWRHALPKGAVVVETIPLSSHRHSNRLLALWMSESHEGGREIEADEPYTCPDETRGSHYLSGRVKFSLVDMSRQRIINTVHLDPPDDPYLDLPLRIRRGIYWTAAFEGESKPVIMRLRDVNGDGLAHEFTLYQEDSCSLVWGSLVGYSETQDRVIWYEVHLKVIDGDHVSYQLLHWVDGLYQKGGNERGGWSYPRSYPEQEPRQYAFDIHYDAELQRFEGTETITPLTP